MNHKLTRQFHILYLLLGILGFLITTFCGSYMIERLLESSISKKLYENANRIAESELVQESINSVNLSSIREDLVLGMDYPNSIVWLINDQGQIVLSTRRYEISAENPITLDGFTPSTWGNDYYQVGRFYGYFSADRLSVIAPVIDDMKTVGYVAVHYLMTGLYQSRSELLLIVQVIYLLGYLLAAVSFFLYRHFIHKPFHEISKGVAEFSNGNLSYRIPINTNDEMGYLSQNLNYMANKLDHNSEYQRKFISNISHDFRSPLTSIKGYSAAMLDGTIPPEKQEKYLNIISYEADRLEKLTSGLLTVSKLGGHSRQIHIESFDINASIKTTVATFEGICRTRRITMELILSGEELMVKADNEQIKQVLYNLIHNAIKFSKDNATISIETTEKGNLVFVSVKDRGIGISKENLPKIWDRFYKVDDSRGRDQSGTGLGLAIVREIISSHGQNINVISTEGIGTEFIFTLTKAR